MDQETVFSGESEIVFSDSEMEAAKQLVQLSEDDTLSCSSGTGWSVSGYDGCEGKGECDNTKRREDVVSSKVTDHLVGQSFMQAIMETKTRINKKKKKFRSLARIYRATKEMTRGSHC